MEYFLLAIGILLTGAFFALIVKEQFKIKISTIFALMGAGTAMFPAIWSLVTGYALEYTINFSAMFGDIHLVLDPLSAIFIVVISLMSFIGFVYANGYMKPYLNKGMDISLHCFFLLLLLASMLGVTVVQNGLFFLVVWEIMSISSFFLVIFEGEKKDVLSAGIKYLIYMHLSVIFLTAMVVLLTNKAGNFDFIEYAKILQQNPHIANIAFVLGFIGFGIKSGFVPFHNWLPDAHPAAPTHVSGIMSGVMIKTGIYGILRLILMIGTPSRIVSYGVLAVAVVSALYGVIYAITQHDIKRLLAYHSIENIGIIGIGIGIGMLGLSYGNPIVAMLGFTGGIMHVLNHSIFKELLFFASGSTYLKTHTRNIELLGGLIKPMPYTALMFIIGSAAICGMPPFNGFISEFLIYAGMIQGLPAPEVSLFITLVITIAALGMVGTMAILCFTKAAGIIFLGEPRSDASKEVESDVSSVMLLPMGILAILTFFIGIFPQCFVTAALVPVTQLVLNNNKLMIVHSIVDLTSSISWFVLAFIAAIVLVYIIRNIINKRYEEHTTWGCGYDKPTSRMQYTASSYASPFILTLKPLFKRVSHIKKPKEFFPKEAYYEQEIEDIEEAYIVKPILKWDEKILTKFERIQNGNIQQYILVGLIFLLLAIVGVFFIG